jgi:hypothetical protein
VELEMGTQLLAPAARLARAEVMERRHPASHIPFVSKGG